MTARVSFPKGPATDFGAVFGNVVREHRRASGIAAAELSRRAGLTQEMVGIIERGSCKRGGTVMTLMAVAEALGMKPSKLMAAVEERIRGRGRSAS